MCLWDVCILVYTYTWPGQSGGKRPDRVRRTGAHKGLNITSRLNLSWRIKNLPTYITLHMTSSGANPNGLGEATADWSTVSELPFSLNRDNKKLRRSAR